MKASRRFLNRPIQTPQTESAEPFFSPASKSAVQTKSDDPFFTPSVSSTQGTGIQTKLEVNAPGDKHEQEADAMANHVVQRMASPEKEKDKIQKKDKPEEEKLQRKTQEQDEAEKSKGKIQRMSAPKEEEKGKVQRMSAPKEEEKNKVQRMSAPKEEEKNKVQRMSAPKEEEKVQRKCAECEEEDHVQRKADGSGTAPSGVTQQIQGSKGQGSTLSDNTRAEMESSFGADFSNVRIHNDSKSSQMNDELHAQAFTHGSDIYFNEGKYNPQNTEGARLLAHELTHVVQQGETVARQKIQKQPAPIPSTAASPLNVQSVINPDVVTILEDPATLMQMAASQGSIIPAGGSVTAITLPIIQSNQTGLAFRTRNNGAEFQFNRGTLLLTMRQEIHVSSHLTPCENTLWMQHEQKHVQDNIAIMAQMDAALRADPIFASILVNPTSWLPRTTFQQTQQTIQDRVGAVFMQLTSAAAAREDTQQEYSQVERQIRLRCDQDVARILRRGMYGQGIDFIQGVLNDTGNSTLPPLAVDGIFGSLMEARVREFQRQHQLQPDGVVGSATKQALNL